MADLDTIAHEAFAASLGPLFEGAPQFLARLAAARPFGSPEAMFARARAIAHAMPEIEQVELVDAHPRLGATKDAVSALSFTEQGYNRPDGSAQAGGSGQRLDVAEELDRLNREYEARFGFRYCVFVAGRSRAALLPDMRAALDGGRAAELHRALDAVVDIAADRYRATATKRGGSA